DRPPVRRPGTGRARGRRGGDGACKGQELRQAVPGGGRLRAGGGGRACYLGGLCAVWGRRGRDKSAGRRFQPRECTGPSAVAGGRSPSHPLQPTQPAMLLSGTSRLRAAGEAAEFTVRRKYERDYRKRELDC